MVNIHLGPEYDLGRRLRDIEAQLRTLATQPILLNASTGQGGEKGVSTDAAGVHLFDVAGNEILRLDTATGSLLAFGDVGRATLTVGGSVGSTVPVLIFDTFDGGGVQTAGASLYQSFNEFLISGPRTSSNGSSQAIISARDTGAWARAYGSSGAGAAYANVSTNGTFYLGNWGATAGIYTAAANGPVTVVGGLSVSGTKNFVMDHPTLPGMTLQHASTESPVNGVEYWGSVTLDGAGEAVVGLPDYFEALTKAEGRNVQLTAVGGPAGALGASRVVGGSFTVYGESGQVVDWLVKAIRQQLNEDGLDTLEFEAVHPSPQQGPPTPPDVSLAPVVDSPAADGEPDES